MCFPDLNLTCLSVVFVHKTLHLNCSASAQVSNHLIPRVFNTQAITSTASQTHCIQEKTLKPEKNLKKLPTTGHNLFLKHHAGHRLSQDSDSLSPEMFRFRLWFRCDSTSDKNCQSLSMRWTNLSSISSMWIYSVPQCDCKLTEPVLPRAVSTLQISLQYKNTTEQLYTIYNLSPIRTGLVLPVDLWWFVILRRMPVI